MSTLFKYAIAKKLGDFPKTHSLNEVLEEVKKVYPKKRKFIEKFQKEEASVIGDLNQAYITSRYLPVEFTHFQVEKMLEFTERLIDFLSSL